MLTLEDSIQSIRTSQTSPGCGQVNYRDEKYSVAGRDCRTSQHNCSVSKRPDWVLARNKAFSYLIHSVYSTSKKTVLPLFYRGGDRPEETQTSQFCQLGWMLTTEEALLQSGLGAGLETSLYSTLDVFAFVWGKAWESNGKPSRLEGRV